MRRVVAALVALAVLAALVVVGLGQARGGEGEDEPPTALTRSEVLAPLRGAPAELAQLHRRAGELLPGGRRALTAELRRVRGRPAVVNLWASWCAPCRRELPFFQGEAARQGKQVAFLGVNVEDSRAGALRLAQRFPVPYPSVLDPDRAVARDLGALGLPATAFYRRDGRLEVVKSGSYRSEDDLARDIERYAASS